MNQNQQPGKTPQTSQATTPPISEAHSSQLRMRSPLSPCRAVSTGPTPELTFPLPREFAPLTPNGAPTTVVQRPKRRTGTLIVGAALAAVLGAGAGVASYAYLSDGQTASPVSVTSAAAPSPTLNGTVTAAAAKIEPSLVTIAVQSHGGGDIGSGMVLDKDGHILTNNHVIAAAGDQGGTSPSPSTTARPPPPRSSAPPSRTTSR